MIQISRIEEQNIEALKKFMQVEQLNYDDVSLCLETLFVVMNGSEVLGFGYYNIYDNDIFLDHLYIGKKERLNKLGDSLFRAILNSLYLQGVEEVMMRDSTYYSAFLQKENIVKNKKNLYVIDLEAFFNRKCKSEKISQTPLN